MIRPFLAPQWLVGHLALAVVVGAFVLFGQWQLDTYGNETSPARTTGTVDLEVVVQPGDRLPDGAVGRRVRVKGSYDGARQLLVPGREHKGRKGFLVVTPLRSDRGIVVVHRGWVGKVDDAALGGPGERVTVTGVLQPSEGERASQVDVLTPLPVGQIAYLSTVELQEALPYPPEELYDGYLLLSSQEPAAREAPEQVAPQPVTDGSGRWRNLAYAFQWWLFAAAAVFLWVSLIRRAVSDHQTPAELG